MRSSRRSHVLVVLVALGVVGSPPFFAAESYAADGPPLAGTQPLTWTGDISTKMVTDLHKFADQETAASVARRARHWKRELSSVEANRTSLQANRERLAKSLGVTLPGKTGSYDRGKLFDHPRTGNMAAKSMIIRWTFPVDGKFQGEAVQLEPTSGGEPPVVILLGDADQSPEELLDVEGKLPAARRIAARLAESGFRVVIPRLVNRGTELSVVAGTRTTPQPHREFIQRQAFEMGRSQIGFELQTIFALVERYHRPKATGPKSDGDLAVVGYGEGGLLALYAGALDPRIDIVGVSGYFAPREELWKEPIYRNVWGLLNEFGDAELAAMIAPRKLLVEASATPQVDEPVRPANVRNTKTPGTLQTPDPAEVRREFDRAKKLVAEGRGSADFGTLILSGDGRSEHWSEPFWEAVAQACDADKKLIAEGASGRPWKAFDPPPNLPVVQQIEHTQALLRESEYVRKDYWKDADRASRDPAKWQASCAKYRKHFYDEVLGRFEHPLLPPNARTRQIYDTEKYRGYEVVLDVFGDVKQDAGVFAYGHLLVPKDLQRGERRPVVVCQHGLEGRPADTIGPSGERHYHMFAAKLAERGFITFAPQNPYLGNDHFRTLVRKLYPLKKTLWSVIVPQHEQITAWLASLEFVDPARIGFYGLSYGGKTAMRVPALVDRYCLSICSGDFNEWVRKCVSTRDTYSYMQTSEYEMYEFDLGHTFNYAEMAYLIAPRPFMVERGHRDGVGVDEWVSYEYAKVRMLYADLKIPERTEIEYFDGPHEIHAVGTFDFLHRHLKRPPQQRGIGAEAK